MLYGTQLTGFDFARGAALAVAALCASVGPVSAQQLNFDAEIVAQCAARDGDSRGCIGRAATACMKDSVGGDSTVGMGGCLDRELQVWDGMLNTEYQRVVAVMERRDAEGAEYNVPPMQPALRDMQRAWVVYRDATCDFERSQWGGGTGGGPATIGCLMRLTAEQALYLSTEGLPDGQ